MACSPTPETLGHPPLCNDNRPLFGPACGGPQNLAGEVESLSHINRWKRRLGGVLPYQVLWSERSNPGGFHDIRSGRRCGIRPGEARPGHGATRTAISVACFVLSFAAGEPVWPLPERSRLCRIVRLCLRHSRRGRNGQSRSTGLGGRNQLLVVMGSGG